MALMPQSFGICDEKTDNPTKKTVTGTVAGMGLLSLSG